MADVIISDTTRAFFEAEKWPEGWQQNRHYLLRVMQRELFPYLDFGLTRDIWYSKLGILPDRDQEIEPFRIGKRARLEMVAPDKSMARVIDSKGSRHVVELSPRELMNMGDMGASLSSISGNEFYCKDIIYPMLARYARTEAKEYTFRVLVEDLFAFASPEDNMIAIYSPLKGNPVAEFHEIGEYLIRKGIMGLRMESGYIVISFDGEDHETVIPSTDTMQFIICPGPWCLYFFCSTEKTTYFSLIFTNLNASAGKGFI